MPSIPAAAKGGGAQDPWDRPGVEPGSASAFVATEEKTTLLWKETAEI